MRIFLVSLGSIAVVFVCFLIAKLWGQSQAYPEYQHPMFNLTPVPVEFIKPSFAKIETDLKEKEFLFLDVGITQDQKLVMPKRLWKSEEKPISYSTIDEIKNDVVNLQDTKDLLKNKKIIFNLIENSTAEHERFVDCMKQLGFEKGDNFIVMSPFEAPIKALKELAPAYVYGTTQPEILKILAMGSMYLYETVNIRADFIIHPLQIRKQPFFTEALVKEIQRRHKKIIVGPMTEAEKAEAVKLSPYGLVLED